MDIFDQLPLNTNRTYVMGRTYNGCEVYLPCKDDSEESITKMREQLDYFLLNQLIDLHFFVNLPRYYF